MSETESTFKPFLFVFIFLGMLFFLVASIPTVFFQAHAVAEYQTRPVQIPDAFESVDILYYADTWNGTVSLTMYDFDAGGWSFRMGTYPIGDKIYLMEIRKFLGGWFWVEKECRWYNEKGMDVSHIPLIYTHITLDPDTIDTYYSIGSNTSHFYADNGRIRVDVYFSYDQDTYSSASDALNNSALQILVGIEFDDLLTKLNAFQLIASLIFFNIPNIHPMINFIIKIPFWGTVAFLTAIWIYRTIKALPFT